jgi:hypothetical protein
MTSHQFAIFHYNDLKPKLKPPMSAAMVKKAKAEYKAGNYKNCAVLLRDIRERLEAFEQRITNKKHG